MVATDLTFQNSPTFSYFSVWNKNKFPWPNKYKMSDLDAASGINLQLPFSRIHEDS